MGDSRVSPSQVDISVAPDRTQNFELKIPALKSNLSKAHNYTCLLQIEHYYKDGGLKEYHKHVPFDYNNENTTYEKYYTNGQLHYRINLKGSRRHGLFELYDEHGEMIEKGSYAYDEIKDGHYEGYFEDGQLYQRCFYKNGLLEGSFEEYHPNGQLYRRCVYKNGLREGIFEVYYIFGKLNFKRNYVNGKIQDSKD